MSIFYFLCNSATHFMNNYAFIFLFGICACMHAVASAMSNFCDPTDCSPSVSSVRDSPGKNPGVGRLALLQVFCVPITAAAAAAKSLSRVRLCATPQTAAHQAPPSLGFSRQEHGSGLPFPSPVHESGE